MLTMTFFLAPRWSPATAEQQHARPGLRHHAAVLASCFRAAADFRNDHRAHRLLSGRPRRPTRAPAHFRSCAVLGARRDTHAPASGLHRLSRAEQPVLQFQFELQHEHREDGAAVSRYLFDGHHDG